MVRSLKIFLIISGILYFFTNPGLARTKVVTNVKVIHASTGSNHVDPGLRATISELKSVFKYTSYKLLKNQRLNLDFNQKGRITIPGKRALIIEPKNMAGKRIRYQINIEKNNHSIFQTQVLLKNNNSITIGGPQFKNGVLLFHISGSIQ